MKPPAGRSSPDTEALPGFAACIFCGCDTLLLNDKGDQLTCADCGKGQIHSGMPQREPDVEKYPTCALCGSPVAEELWQGGFVCGCGGTSMSPVQIAEWQCKTEEFVVEKASA